MAEKDPAEPGADEREPVEPADDQESVDETEQEDDKEPGEEPEPDEDEEAGEEPEEEPRQRPAAREGRKSANEKIRELRERARRAERERDDFARRVTGGGGQDTRAAQQQYETEQNRLLQAAQEADQLNPAGGAVARYYYERSQRENNFRLQQQRNESFERDDAREFRSICREERVPQRVREAVETAIAAARANGNYALTREAYYNHYLGMSARERRAEKLGVQQERGNRRILRETVKPPRGGGDARAPGRRKKESEMSAEEIEANFGNIPIGSLR